MSALSRSRYGTAPMWSSCPWVRTIAVDVVEPVRDVLEVGQDQVDAGVVVLGEEHAAVDDEQPAGVLEDGHVAADLAEPAEGDDAERRPAGSGGGAVSSGWGWLNVESSSCREAVAQQRDLLGGGLDQGQAHGRRAR